MTVVTGALAWLNGEGLRLPELDGYTIATIVTVLSNCVGAFSSRHDVIWRMGAPNNLWEPALWEASSGIVVLALLPFARTGALLLGAPRLRAGVAITALALIYSALHIIGMGFVREAAYRVAGWHYAFPWSNQIVYELRKDLFSFTVFVVIFWLTERRARITATSRQSDAIATDSRSAPAEHPPFWIRDGRNSVLIDPSQIVTVTAAGNYVEYVVSGGQTHLIRATLQSQANQLALSGLTRVHRGRLVNLRRVIAIDWRASGDFELRLDTGETVAGSRRFKTAVADFVG